MVLETLNIDSTIRISSFVHPRQDGCTLIDTVIVRVSLACLRFGTIGVR
jgi:hypothetical protein